MDGVLVGAGSLWLLTQYWTCGGLFPVWVGVTYLLNKINKRHNIHPIYYEFIPHPIPEVFMCTT